MAVDESMRLTQETKLQQRLAPMQVQFVRVLEMTGPEVEDEVRRVVDENPALVESDSRDEMAENYADAFKESAEDLQMADYRNDDEIPSYRLEARNHSVNDTYYEPMAVASDDNIIDNLESQLGEMQLDEQQLLIARYIIGNLDDNGYLSRELHDMADDLAFSGIDISVDYIKSIFELVRTLEPAGIGAIDLRDCLLLQLSRKAISPRVEIARCIVKDYFDLFSKKHYEKLCNQLNINQDQLKEAYEVISSLNPKPGSIINGGADDARLRHIIPDFSVEVDDNCITLTLLNNIPELQIAESFSEISGTVKDKLTRQEKEAQVFIKQKREEANTFIQVLKMRQNTLFKVMEAIVKKQRDFFLTEDESLIKPMILKDISEITGYDLSVISRATANKYVATAGGIYPLKLFFNERPKEDDDTSSHEILAALKEIVDNENKNRPLSDEAITTLLKGKGYDIARRTVAKYREKLGLPVARLRKELK